CSLKYADDEGDLCTLAPATFNDFVEQQGGSTAKVLKLKLQLPKKLPPKKTDDLPKSETSPSASAEAQPGATERPRHGPPPGLGKEEDDASECSSSRAGLWGPCGGGGGPRRLVMALRALRDAGVLTPAMFASLAVQWLPLVTQRVTRKVDKINHMARDGLSQSLQKLLQEVKDRAAVTAGLESFAAPLGEALSDAPGPRTLGQAILELLKALRGLGFEAQARFSEGLASHLLPLLDDILAPQAEGSRERSSPWCGGPGPAAWQHHFGVECDGCKAAPLVGPRFKCPACPDYDLCGRRTLLISFEVGDGDQNLNTRMINVSHSIKHLSFSDPDDGRYHRKGWANLPNDDCPTAFFCAHADVTKHLSPLDGRNFLTQAFHQAYIHDLKVVSTVAGGKTSYQFKYTGRVSTLAEDKIPQAQFHYDIEPFSINVKRDEKRWYDFGTSLCAILGGAFVVMRLISRFTLGVVKTVDGKKGHRGASIAAGGLNYD
ncbi:unnamed protein product, partial [Polarella glacialis]